MEAPVERLRSTSLDTAAQACRMPAGGLLATQLTYVGAAAGEYDDSLQVAALLTDASGNPLAGRALTFALGAQTASATTDANGVGQTHMSPAAAPGNLLLSVTFAGDATTAAAQVAATIALAKEETVLRLTGSAYLAVGMPQTVTGTLTEADGTPIAGKSISFNVSGAIATATTDPAGVATASVLIASGRNGIAQLTAGFAGDADYDSASAQAPVTLFQPTAFVIWGGNPTPPQAGQDVNFWGHSWADQVTGGDYAANPSFKGFANKLVAYSICEGGNHTSSAPLLDQNCWTTKGGNSSPPESLPPYIGVLVSTAVEKSGSLIFGNVAGLAVLQVDATPAYGSNPGHPGYGHIVALDTGSGFPGAPSLTVTQTEPATVLPGQSYAVALSVTNTGAAGVSTVSAAEQFDRASPAAATLAIGSLAAGATGNGAVTETAPALSARQSGESLATYEARLAAAELQLGSAVAVSFTDANGNAAQPVKAFSTTQVVLPRLTVALTAAGAAGPGQTVQYAVRVSNIGSAYAQSTAGALTLPDGATKPFSVGALAPGASATTTLSWTVPAIAPKESGETTAVYLARLQQRDGKQLLSTASVTWTDAAGNSYGAVDAQAATSECVPILTFTAAALPSLEPGQSQPLVFTVTNGGSGNAFAIDVGLRNPDGSASTATLPSLNSGETATVQLNAVAPTFPPRQPGETDAQFVQRLGASDGASLTFTYSLDWRDAASDLYGPLDSRGLAAEVLPDLGISLSAPLAVNPGQTIPIAATVTNSGHAAAASGAVALVLPDGSSQTLSVGTLAPGASRTLSVNFTVAALSPPLSGETTSAYLARIAAPDGRALPSQASLTWNDAVGNQYGPLSPQATTTEQVAVVSATSQTVAASLPGQALVLGFKLQNTGLAAAPQISLSAQNPDGTAAGSARTTLASGQSTLVSVSARAPQVTAKGQVETDTAYLARLASADSSALSFAANLSWEDPSGGAYGPASNPARGTLVLPVLRVALTAPSIAGPGGAIQLTATVTNTGHAAATSAQIILTMPDGSTASPALPAIAAGASAHVSTSYQVPPIAPRGPNETSSAYLARLSAANAATLSWRAALSWNDGAGNSYGAISAVTSTTQALPVLQLSLTAPADTAPGGQGASSITITNTGLTAASSPTLSVSLPDGSTRSPVVSEIGPGASATVSMSWATPLVPRRLSGESGDAYLTRLRAADSAVLASQASLGWSDSANTYGTVSAQARTVQHVPVLVPAPLTVAAVVPGQPFTLSFIVPNQGSSPAASATLRSNPASQAFTVGAGASATVQLSVPSPALATRATSETDTTYLARLQAAAAATISNPWMLDWSGATSDSYGTIDGTAQGTQILPIVTLAIVAPATALSGDTIHYALTATNSGTAAAQSLTAQLLLPSGATVAVQLPAPLAAGASASADVPFAIPVTQPTGTLSAQATVIWQDAAGLGYGPMGASASTGVTNPASMSLAIVAAPTANPGQLLTYHVTATNTGPLPLSSATGTFIFPDRTTASLSFGALVAGASAPVDLSWRVPSVPRRGGGTENIGGGEYFATDDDYRAMLHQSDGTQLAVSAAAQASASDGTVVHASASATTTEAIPILVITAAAPTSPYVAGDAIPLALTIVNQGSGAAHRLALFVNYRSSIPTVADIPAASTVHMTLTIPGPAAPNCSSDGTGCDVATSNIAVRAYWRDDASALGFPYGWIETQTAGTVNEPILTNVLTADLPHHLPSQPVNLTLNTQNVGHADATGVSLSTATAFYTLPDVAPSASATFSPAAAGSGPLLDNTVFGNDYVYERYLHQSTDLGWGTQRLPATLGWQDRNGNAFSNASSVLSDVIAPIIVPQSLTAPSVYIGQTANIALKLHNEGSAPGQVSAMLSYSKASDQRTIASSVTVAAGQDGVASFQVAPGYSSAAQAGETRAVYMARLFDYLYSPPRLIATQSWTDAMGDHYGPVYSTYESLMFLAPVLWAPTTLSLDAGAPLPIELLDWGNTTAVTPQLVFHLAPYPDFPCAFPDSDWLGFSSRSCTWLPPIDLTNPGSDDGTFLARLRALAAPIQGSAALTWRDWIGDPFGPIAIPVTAQINPAVVTLLPIQVATVLPGDGVPVPLRSELASVSAVTFHTSSPVGTNDVTVNAGPSFANGAVFNATVPVTAPAPGRSTFTDDASYLAALSALETSVAMTFAATWVDGVQRTYGPIHGSAQTNIVAPIVRESISGPANAAAGSTGAFNFMLTNVGHAPATVSATLANAAFSKAITANLGASASASFPVTLGLPAAPGTAAATTLTVTWTDTSGHRYGPISGSVTTSLHDPEGRLLVTAIAPGTIRRIDGATLTGILADPTLPQGATIKTHWSQVSGPGWATFANAASLSTQASFSENGEYVLKLSASDGVLSGEGEVRIAVLDQLVNQPPVVDAGPPLRASLSAPVPPDFSLQTLATGLPFPRSVDDFPSGGVLVSVSPHTLEVVHPDGSYAPFSSLNDFADEIYFASIRDDLNTGISLGGFHAGDIFVGTGLPGNIARISADGRVIQNPWVNLPGETGLLRGGLTIDRSGSFGGDLLVCTTSGGVWRVNAAGQPTQLANVGTLTEGIGVIPNDPKYGPWAGTAVVAAENAVALFSIDAVGHVQRWDLGIASPESVHVVPPNENFFGADVSRGTIWAASAAQLAPYVGDIFVTEEYGARLWRVRWDGTQFVKSQLAQVGIWEGIGFSPHGILGVESSIVLHGTATDDGLPSPPAALTYAWSKLSGPGNVTFFAPHALDTGATFSQPGTYALQLTADDSQLQSSSTVTVTVEPVLQSPRVDAGGDQQIMFPATAQLAGRAVAGTDGNTTFAWTQVSGPGTATFAAPSALATTVSFSAPGRYRLRLSATASGLAGTSDLLVDVMPYDEKPIVNAGPDLDVQLPSAPVQLAGSATGYQGRHVGVLWKAIVGPGMVTFDDPTAQQPLATFDVAGAYTLEMFATDGELSAAAFARVTVVQATAPNAAPIVDAGAAQTLTLPTLTAQLAGSVHDDGKPIGATLSIGWTLVSGPGTATFSNASSPTTQVSFSGAGRYTLRLSANDTQYTTTSDVIISVVRSGSSGPGGLYVTGHAPDAEGSPGASAQLRRAINYVTSGKPSPHLLLVSDPRNPGGVQGNPIDGLTAAGFTAGSYDLAGPDGATAGWLDLHTISFNSYDVVLVASDFGGWLRQDELDILNARAAEIATYVNSGGGLIALGESGARPTPPATIAGTVHDRYAFVPAQLGSSVRELASGFQLSAAGWAVGLWNYDVSNSPAHAIFASACGLDVIDTGPAGEIVTVAKRGVNVVAGGLQNQAPVVSISTPALGIADNYLRIDYTVTDDGLPAGSTVTVVWTKVSGPGDATLSALSPTLASVFLYTSIPGEYRLRLTASDGQLSTSADVGVTVLPNRPHPSVDAGAAQSVQLPSAALLQGAVSEANLPAGLSLRSTWSLDSGPGLVVFDDPTALQTRAHFSVAGTYVLRLTADDGQLSASSVLAVTVGAAPSTQPPFVSAGAPQTIQLPQSVAQMHGTAVDPGAPVLASAWNEVSGPGIVAFDDGSNPLAHATFAVPGEYLLQFTATDGTLSASAQVTITVLPQVPVNQPPQVAAGPGSTLTWPQNVAQLAGVATDDGLPAGHGLVVSWRKVAGDGNVVFAPAGQAVTQATFGWPGSYLLELEANDGQYTSHAQVVVNVLDPAGNVPVVTLTSPDDGAPVTAPTTIEGQVSEGAWKLETRSDGDETGSAPWRTIASGFGAASGVLAQLDPTQMRNGVYALRLTAQTSAGQSEDDRSIIVDKNLKLGNFNIAFNDVSIPVTGMPIQVVRSYDTRDEGLGDFGNGWRLSLQDVRVEKTAVIGKFWTQSILGSFSFPTYCLAPTRADVVSVIFPNGKVYRFDVTVDVGGGAKAGSDACQQLSPAGTVDVKLVPQAGTVGSLAIADQSPTAMVQPVGGTAADGPGSMQLIDLSDSSIYNPRLFVLTVEDGTQYTVAQGTGLVSVTDRNGNTLSLNANGISSSAGKSVAFVRDASGRIAQITDPNGTSLLYSYDVSGNLIGFTDRTGSTTHFAYDTFNKLLSITDARGKQMLTNGYDPTGRLINTADANGKSMQYAHDLANHRETVTDRAGNVTSYDYDTDGNVVHLKDALGHDTYSTYDANDNKLSETDALGNTTSWTYDAANNKLSETDALGNTSRWTYDNFAQVLTTTDPLGHVTTNVRQEVALCARAQATGNLLSTTDALGNKTSYSYDSCSGNLQSQTDARGGVTSYVLDSAGRMTSMTDALGNVTFYTYDADGNQLTETRSGVTTQYQYDASGRRTKVTYADGSTTSTVYNSIGKPTSTTDQLGRVTSYIYDDQGRLTTTTYSDGTSTSTTYDVNGRRASSTDRGGRTTTFAYDAVGRLTTTTYPDGSSRSTVYDAAGRVTSSVDELGYATSYAYDAAGRRTKVTDALGNATQFTYDAAGNQLAVTDPLGHSTQYGYDALNRQVKTTYADGTSDSTSYDATGNRISRTDQSGLVTQYGYDLLGRLTSVTDALHQITSYAYDALGNHISQSDANGHTTLFGYDSLGRRTSRTLPMGQVESFSYYADGQVKTRKDFNGHTTTYVYDTAGRLTKRTPDPFFSTEPPVSWTYFPTGRRVSMTDATGTTSYTYDSRDRLLSKSTPEGSLTYTYDAAGNHKTVRSDSGSYSVTYGYDALNRLSTVTNNGPGGGTTTYHYDNASRLGSYDYPNGISTAFAYDSLNRTQAIKIGSALGTPTEHLVGSYAYTFYATGNRNTVAELSGRCVTWAYDNLWRLQSETIAGGSASGSVTYGLDSVGNRTSRASTLPGLATASSSFDNDDRLSSDGWDADGNTTSSGGNLHTYDSEHRLVTAQTTNGTISYQYDGDGTLVAKTVGGVQTAYLVDADNPTGYSQVVEDRVAGAATSTHVYGLYGVISQKDSGGYHYYGWDVHSGVRLLLDGSGTVTDTYDYDAFGNLIGRTGNTLNEHLYRGEKFDWDLSLQNLRARWMDPAKGRFATRDTWEGTVYSPFSQNLYTFSLANPVGFNDPTGHDATLSEISVAEAGVAILASAALYVAYKGVVGGTLDTGKIHRFVQDTLARQQPQNTSGTTTRPQPVPSPRFRVYRGLSGDDYAEAQLGHVDSYHARTNMGFDAALKRLITDYLGEVQKHVANSAFYNSIFVSTTTDPSVAADFADFGGSGQVLEWETSRPPEAIPLLLPGGGVDYEKELLYFYSIFPVAFDDWTTITSDQARSLPAGPFPP